MEEKQGAKLTRLARCELGRLFRKAGIDDDRVIEGEQMLGLAGRVKVSDAKLHFGATLVI